LKFELFHRIILVDVVMARYVTQNWEENKWW